ncbi:lasso peptide biosynthesis PqqD family chaperone [Niallia taxi]|uniref:Lasso peptide biosynthesis PqqD family chaperone n=1 Tax=Niallia taxi TaxID=2499688 RepID=A0A3S2TWZ6_9BACI|nr:lasso peptide biosynthesis PqqD family chaperone [Niallia taxi]MED4036163.1 lasso peptide biosynthesis PqqD family chaperone [Niallia taxi]RVT62481.1 lasso peptide biosynthesis PqqD family chaperone [Niallia taxi]
MSELKNVLLAENRTICQSEGQIVSDMNGEKVMLSISNGKYYNLGTTGGAIWELIRTPITFDGIIVNLTEKYDVKKEECEKEVINFLEVLWKEDLVKVSNIA